MSTVPLQLSGLSARERTILNHLAIDQDERMIADNLGISREMLRRLIRGMMLRSSVPQDGDDVEAYVDSVIVWGYPEAMSTHQPNEIRLPT